MSPARRSAEIDWQYRGGRDGGGEAYAVWLAVHGSGRILAKVHDMSATGGYQHRADFYCAVPASVLDTKETFDFIDRDSAVAFVEDVLCRFDPLAAPVPKT